MSASDDCPGGTSKLESYTSLNEKALCHAHQLRRFLRADTAAAMKTIEPRGCRRRSER